MCYFILLLLLEIYTQDPSSYYPTYLLRSYFTEHFICTSPWVIYNVSIFISKHLQLQCRVYGVLFQIFLVRIIFFWQSYRLYQASLMAERVKRLPTMQETQVPSLGQEDPLEKEMAPHSCTLAWKIPWMEEHGRLQSMRSQRVGHNWATALSFPFTDFISWWQLQGVYARSCYKHIKSVLW